jgi:hypothetical protein
VCWRGDLEYHIARASIPEMSEYVRPTQRALRDLALTFPPLDVELHSLDNALIQKSQAVTSEVAAGGAERVLALKDRVWFRVKTTDLRGVAGEVETAPEFGPGTSADLPASAWWLTAAGHRQDDTKNRDFYANLEAECRRAAKGSSAAVCSAHLVPTHLDCRRWELEKASLVVVTLQRKVREAIARAAQTGNMWIATIGTFQLGALVKQVDGETYLAITADGFWDSKVLAILLNAVPDTSGDDWQIEPSDVMGITPREGQIIYSTMIPPESLSQILDEIDDHFL